MAGRLLRSLQVMNAISMFMFVVGVLHLLCHHGKAQADSGALTIVPQDDQENGEVTLEPEDEELVARDVNIEPFMPTKDWKPVETGQSIPAGLHVRMNLQTGEREAKLLDGHTDKQAEVHYGMDGDREGKMNLDHRQLSMNELKRALKDFKTTELDDTDLKREDEVKMKFRSYKELQADFKAMNMDIQTDGEILTGLVERLIHPETPHDDLIAILKDFEYYLHQIDNGVMFMDLGGWPYLLKLLNRTNDEEIQIETALVLGASMSSNPKVQIRALEAGTLELLVRLLSTQPSIQLRRKLLFALAAQCRQFPFAQRRLLELGGLQALNAIFDEAGTEKLRVKAVSFLNDLLIERVLTEKNLNPDLSTEVEKVKQYKEVELEKAMVEGGWCEQLPTLLSFSDHESREHVIIAMTTLATPCRDTFTRDIKTLQKLNKEYTKLALEDEDGVEDSYFNTHAELIQTLLTKLFGTDTRIKKDEL
ncbi:nucleotide exchange factor SIL1-like [Mya arenaria]|uniref:nucleotide exchange factor SIL1-like n=1 Tax=Mya arenaria TaxID=6604 RepID=UPI0022E2085A|nr:nucleotide exchange factor SIL1-like [Mya arenaria]